jgi:phosphoadenosine phosphosulfate reductase
VIVAVDGTNAMIGGFRSGAGAGGARAALEAYADSLGERFRGLDGLALIEAVIHREFGKGICLVSSFGAESAALLDMVARVDPATPVIFLDTLKLFGETLAYRERLVERLGLTDVRNLRPDPADLAREDPDADLWRYDTDACCNVRKVLPLERALGGFHAWISGRKRFHGGEREKLPYIEADGPRIKVNPLAGWTQKDVDTYFAVRNLPRHPLIADGYLSIGCAACTRPVRPGEDPRAGRWAESGKTECGIHADYWKASS